MSCNCLAKLVFTIGFLVCSLSANTEKTVFVDSWAHEALELLQQHFPTKFNQLKQQIQQAIQTGEEQGSIEIEIQGESEDDILKLISLIPKQKASTTEKKVAKTNKNREKKQLHKKRKLKRKKTPDPAFVQPPSMKAPTEAEPRNEETLPDNLSVEPVPVIYATFEEYVKALPHKQSRMRFKRATLRAFKENPNIFIYTHSQVFQPISKKDLQALINAITKNGKIKKKAARWCSLSIRLESGDYQCSTCQQDEFNNKNEVLKHQRDIHDNKKVITCMICGNVYSSTSGFSTHRTNAFKRNERCCKAVYHKGRLPS